MPRRRAPQQMPELCPDWHWGFLPRMNQADDPGWHVAKDLGWFTTYKRLPAGIYAHLQGPEGPPVLVEGVGTVKLELHNDTGSNPITLQKVLHIPTMEYGIICEKQLQLAENKIYSISFADAAYPNGVVRHNDAVVTVFNNIKLLHDFPEPNIDSAFIVQLAGSPRNHTLGASRFREMLEMTQSIFARWVWINSQHWDDIERAFAGARPTAQA